MAHGEPFLLPCEYKLTEDLTNGKSCGIVRTVFWGWC